MRVFEAKLVYSLVSLGEEVTLDTPEKVAAYLESAYAENPMQEAFFTVLLDRKNHPLGRHMVTLGTLTSSLVHCRETFRAAIVGGAASIVVSHNHPSGDPRPSSADLSVTRQLRDASQIIGIDLVDHVIVGEKAADPTGKGYYSFREAGII
jgi:DNA repair protein RadC